MIANHLPRHRISRLEKYEREWNKRRGIIEDVVKEIPTENPNHTLKVEVPQKVQTTASDKDVSHNPLSSMCKFHCKPCNEVFPNWTATTKHLRTKHKNRQFGKRTVYDINKYVIERHQHSCFLCGKQVLQDLKLISSHVGAAHKMPLSKYRELLLQKDGNLDVQVQHETRQPKTRNKNRQETTTPISQDKNLEENVEKDTDAPKMDPRVLNLDMVKTFLKKEDSFECRICGRIFRSAGAAAANRHVVFEHGINLVQYIRMTSPQIKSGTNTCKARH